MLECPDCAKNNIKDMPRHQWARHDHENRPFHAYQMDANLNEINLKLERLKERMECCEDGGGKHG